MCISEARIEVRLYKNCDGYSNIKTSYSFTLCDQMIISNTLVVVVTKNATYLT